MKSSEENESRTSEMEGGRVASVALKLEANTFLHHCELIPHPVRGSGPGELAQRVFPGRERSRCLF